MALTFASSRADSLLGSSAGVLVDGVLVDGVLGAGVLVDGERFERQVATLECLARLGFAKTTIDDVAKAAGCSRATLYRYFPSKAELVRSAVKVELVRITWAIQDAAAGQDDLEDTVVAILLTAGHEVGENPALRYVADFESERLLPHLSFSGGDRFLSRAVKIIAPSLVPFIGERAPRAAEWIARNGLSLWLNPTSAGVLTDPTALRLYVQEFILPALTTPAKNSKIKIK